MARYTIEHYILSSDWLLHPFHIPTFQSRAAQLAHSTLDSVDLAFLATFFCTCGIGLALMSDARATKCGLPTGESKQELSRRWLEGVTQALILDNVRALLKALLITDRLSQVVYGVQFLQNPSLEAIRALSMLRYRSCSLMIVEGPEG
jgi:hypothetical protein